MLSSLKRCELFYLVAIQSGKELASRVESSVSYDDMSFDVCYEISLERRSMNRQENLREIVR